jgi:hypothetical protein
MCLEPINNRAIIPPARLTTTKHLAHFRWGGHGAAGRAGPACTGHCGCTTVDTEWGEGGGKGIKKKERLVMLWFEGFFFI